MGLFQRLAMVLGGALCLIAALAIWFLFTGRVDETGVRVLASTAVISLCVVGGLVGVAVLDRQDLRRALGAITALLAAGVASLSLAAIWGVSFGEPVWRALAVSATLLIACGHACLVLGRIRPADGRAVRGLTGAAVGLAMTGALLVAGGFALATHSPGDWFWRFLGVVAVLSTLATLLTPIVRRIDRGRSRGSHPGAAQEPAQPAQASQPSQPSQRSQRSQPSQPEPPAPGRKPGRLWLASGLGGAGR